jgi:tryptophan synthase beta chain
MNQKVGAAGAGEPKAKLQDFYTELEQLLRKQLDEKPGLDDVRIKLLELYFEQQRADEFLKTARTFHRLLPKPADSRDWQRVASMGRMLVPGEPLFANLSNDRIEFVEVPGNLGEPAKVTRFGDDDKYRQLFDNLVKRYAPVRSDPRFLVDLERVLLSLPNWRPTPLVHAKRLSEHLRGGQIYFKREDLADGAPHLTAAITGQALLGLRMGCNTLVTGSSDGRRGVVTAGVAARLGLKSVVFMDGDQAERASANTVFMKLLGADVQLVKVNKYRNRDVRYAALEYWAQNAESSFMVMGLDAAPAPYPVMTQEFTAAIGRECRRQLAGSTKGLPTLLVTRGSTTADALGLFPAFFTDPGTRLICVEPEPQPEVDVRKGADLFTQVGMPMSSRERVVAQSILDKLEYPSVAREHTWLKASGRVEYVVTTRAAARNALLDLAHLEGVITPIGTAHALAFACAEARKLKDHQAVVVLMAEHIDNAGWDIRRLVEEEPKQK